MYHIRKTASHLPSQSVQASRSSVSGILILIPSASKIPPRNCWHTPGLSLSACISISLNIYTQFNHIHYLIKSRPEGLYGGYAMFVCFQLHNCIIQKCRRVHRGSWTTIAGQNVTITWLTSLNIGCNTTCKDSEATAACSSIIFALLKVESLYDTKLFLVH